VLDASLFTIDHSPTESHVRLLATARHHPYRVARGVASDRWTGEWTPNRDHMCRPVTDAVRLLAPRHHEHVTRELLDTIEPCARPQTLAAPMAATFVVLS
jgi:hypothetical protein